MLLFRQFFFCQYQKLPTFFTAPLSCCSPFGQVDVISCLLINECGFLFVAMCSRLECLFIRFDFHQVMPDVFTFLDYNGTVHKVSMNFVIHWTNIRNNDALWAPFDYIVVFIHPSEQSQFHAGSVCWNAIANVFLCIDWLVKSLLVWGVLAHGTKK